MLFKTHCLGNKNSFKKNLTQNKNGQLSRSSSPQNESPDDAHQIIRRKYCDDCSNEPNHMESQNGNFPAVSEKVNKKVK